MKKYTVLFIIICFPCLLSGNIISTVAGTGQSGFIDKTTARQCMLNFPTGIFVDDDGNIYIADSLNNRIRKIIKDPGDDTYQNAGIFTIAGNGDFGYDNSEIPATKVPLATPKSIFAYKENNHQEIFFSDSKNNLIRKINNNGIIKNVAGNTKFGYAGDHGPADKAMLAQPNGIYIDKNKNIYIADTFNHRVRVIYNSGKVANLNIDQAKKGYIYTIAGNGKAGAGSDNEEALNAYIGEPYDVWVDQQQNVYIAQRIGSIVSKLDAATGRVSIIAGVPNRSGFNFDEQPAKEACLNQPFGVTLDAQNNIYIADGNNSRIRQIDNNGYIHTIAGRGEVGYQGEDCPAVDSLFSYPLDIFYDNKGHLFISDSINSVIRMITLTKEN